MAKKSSVEKNNRRIRMSKSHSNKRNSLKAQIYDKNVSMDERFELVMKLAAMPRNGAQTRVRNRCLNSGRSRGYYRKFKLSRIELRTLAGLGLIPGVTKGSW